MTTEQIIAEEREQTAKFEAATVVAKIDGAEYTIADLRRVFDAVCDPTNWKAAWAAYIPHTHVSLVIEACKFFHGDVPTCVGIQPLTSKVLVEGHGYQG